MSLPEQARNPDRNPRALRGELALVLLVLWLPLFLSGVYYRRTPVPGGVPFELLGAASEAAGVALLLYLLWRNQESWRHLGIRRCRWWTELLWAFLIYAACWGSWLILDRMLPGLPDPSPGTAPSREPASALLVPPVLLVAATFEEVFVRGYLWNRFLRLTRSKPFALLASALLFTLYHPYPVRSLVYIFAFGVVLGLFYWNGQSLPRLIVAHTLFNLSITYGWS